ncbi:Na+/H+ antiporter NhaA [Archangium gephyra]|uniref:Na+/H+ antiporter NhaA n=1 Tax=Archangium gephyra TaxID=48 RepID=UPI003B7FF3DC
MRKSTAALPPIFTAVVDPLLAFLRMEATSGILLFVAAVAALGWANSPWADTYTALLAREFVVGFGGAQVHFTLAQFVNDGLMSIFFFVVGMEIKRELVVGELNSPAKALLPAAAAAGGMVIPAGIYLLFCAGTEGAKGWAIPMATDIAFCIGCLTLLKGRVPRPLIVFVTALAIFDDMGGILVIALFYGHGLQPLWLLAAGGLLVLLALLNRLHLRSGLVYAVAGALLWYFIHHAGIHATIAGVLLGLMIPARGLRPVREVLEALKVHSEGLVRRTPEESIANEELLRIEEQIEDLEPPLNRFVHALHPWVAFGIMPVFALTNAGLSLSGMSLDSLTHPVLLGSALGLFVGKQLGVFLFTLVALRAGLSSMPGNASFSQLYGVSALTGIGFTVALFIANLAFTAEPALLGQAKIGILLGSLVSGVAGYGLLRVLKPRVAATSPVAGLQA